MTWSAWLFDLDGTLVDREPLTTAAAQRVLGQLGHEVDDVTAGGWVGRSWPDIFAELECTIDVGIGFEEWHERLLVCAQDLVLDGFEVRTLSGGVELISELSKRGRALGLATGSTRSEAHGALGALGISELFGAVVAAEDYERGKPAPDAYLAAADALAVSISNCVVVEDSAAGIAAARAAGAAFVIATAEVNPAPGSPGHQELCDADVVVEDLARVRPELIDEWGRRGCSKPSR